MGTVTSLIAASAANEELWSRSVVYSLYVCFANRARCRLPREDLGDLFRALGRQRGEEQGVDAAEDRRIAENPNRQRQHGDDREAGRTDQRPDGVPKVLTQRGEEREAPALAMGFDGLGDPAESGKRHLTRLLGRHALPDVVFDGLGEMGLYFGLQLAVTAGPAEESA